MSAMGKTKFFNKEKRNWVLIDAKDKIVGRLSTRIARILKGKDKPTFSPSFLCGDKVVVINAKYIKVSGNKSEQKWYDKYSGYPSGRKEITFKRLMEKNPTRVLYYAVRGMLPKNRLGRQMLRSLKIYPEATHFQGAQNPKKIEV